MAGRPSLRTQLSTTLSSTPNDSASWMMFKYMAKTSNNQHSTSHIQFSTHNQLPFFECWRFDVGGWMLILQPSSFFGAAAGGFVEQFSGAFERRRRSEEHTSELQSL